jgi:hypothetical protein
LIIKKYKSFVLGYCFCKCGQEINIRNKTNNNLIKYKNGHNSKGRTHSQFKGIIKHGGYLLVWKPDYYTHFFKNYVILHRWVYERFHKCCILKWGDIHHINEIKTDNRVSLNSKYNNLEGMTRSRHHRYHALKSPIKNKTYNRKDMSKRFCILCKSKTTYDRLWTNDIDGSFLCSKCSFQIKYYKRKWKL